MQRHFQVGDNSVPNLLPILAAQVEEGLQFPKLDSSGDINVLRFNPMKKTVDPETIKFIWKDMKSEIFFK
ncbi:hypothetical protein GCK32_022415 [Trichostrongylus colubriformis]|uniref:Uncharacterized protein n=1 Tax=Trichostrongylus colubriformis TaxID=6319 RepID=A0AAN8FYJ9_TRICO